eukprot:4411213-Pleurochrysis_carterae.AAC.1
MGVLKSRGTPQLVWRSKVKSQTTPRAHGWISNCPMAMGGGRMRQPEWRATTSPPAAARAAEEGPPPTSGTARASVAGGARGEGRW